MIIIVDTLLRAHTCPSKLVAHNQLSTSNIINKTLLYNRLKQRTLKINKNKLQWRH